MSTMHEALVQAKQQADTTTAQLERNIEELGKSVDRVIRENEALQDELAQSEAACRAHVCRGSLEAREEQREACARIAHSHNVYGTELAIRDTSLDATPLRDELTRARADLATAANVISHLQSENAALLNAFPEYADPQAKLERDALRAELVVVKRKVDLAVSLLYEGDQQAPVGEKREAVIGAALEVLRG